MKADVIRHWRLFVGVHGTLLFLGALLIYFSTTPAWFWLGVALILAAGGAAVIDYAMSR